MITYSINFRQVTANYLVVQTIERTDIGIGQSVDLSGLGATLNGTYTVFAVPVYLFTGVDASGDLLFNTSKIITNQLMFDKVHADVARTAIKPPATLEFQEFCTWVDEDDVEAWLGIEAATENDEAFITSCVEAANAYAFRRRREAGYFDSQTTAPGGDAKLGTVMFAGGLYRERGSVDSFASFEQMGTTIPFGSNGQINRLLGVNRSQVA
jgi:hypothetical protein